MQLRGLLVAALLVARAIAAPPPPDTPAAPVRHDASRVAMGCLYGIEAYGGPEAAVARAVGRALDEVDRIDRLLSHYRPDSAVSRLNREAAGRPVPVDAELFALIGRSLAYAREWDGAFDVTVGPLMRAWGFFRGEGRVPSDAELAAVRARVGHRHVGLDASRRTVRFALDGVQLDFGAIGKGYAVDRAAALLRRAGVRAALVDACGSTMYALGAPPGADGWTIPLRDPVRADAVAMDVTLRDRALSISGSAEQMFEADGVRYAHILDPRSGRPVSGVLMTAVLAPEATEADVLSTATFVSGLEESRKRLARHPAVKAYVFAPAGRGWRVTRLEQGAGGQR
jgi:thiamine biosynthesis lipoprotein